MKAPKKIVENPGVQASLIVGGMVFLATTAPLLFPKVRKGITHAMPIVKNIIKRADDPTEIKQAVKTEIKDEMADQFRDKLTESIQSKAEAATEKLKIMKDENAEKVHANAGKAKDKVQHALLQVREKIAGDKESGQNIQDKLNKGTRSTTGFRSANQIKGANQLKSAASIKSSTKIKGPKNLKHHADLKQQRV